MTDHRAAGPPIQERRPPLVTVRRPGAVAAAITGLMLVPLIGVVTSVSSVMGAAVAVVAALLLLALAVLGLTSTAEALIILAAFLAPMNDVHSSGALSFVTAADAAFVVGFLLMMPDFARRELHLPPAFMLGVGGVFMIALVSSMLSEEPVLSLNHMARLLVGAFALSILIAWWGPDLKKIVAFAWAYVLGNVVSIVYGLTGGGVSTAGRRAGLTEHPNIFGLCALLGVALIPFLFSQTPRPYRWLPLGAGFVCFLGIWVSGSRGALATMLAVAVVFPLLSRSVPAALGVMGAFAGFLAFSDKILGESSTSNALGRLLGHGSAAGSDLARENLAAHAIDQFQSHPVLGVGLERVLAAHVIYLQIAAGLGAIGLFFYVIVLWTMVRPTVVLKPPFNLLALPALSYVLLGFVTPVLWDRYIWAALALALVAPRLAAAAEPPDDEEEGVADGTARADAPRW